ncbi:MAG: hypothetical protein ACYS21_09715 [Planctomycetota bacterium]
MKHVLSLTVMVSLALLALTSIATAGAPGLMNYQGRLTDAGGDPLDDTVFMIFSIYDDSTGGSLLWDDSATVVVTNGLFNVILGESNAIDDGVFADTARWLQITVEGEDIDPRTRLVTAAYAFRVETVDGATGGIISGDVDIQSDLTVSGKATIGPGHTNTGSWTFVAGESNTATANHVTVGGGYGNSASAWGATVGGGLSNSTSGDQATVGGGKYNEASNNTATVGGGENDTASGYGATVGGGKNNTASGTRATVGGGDGNTASAAGATVPGGLLNTAGGLYSFAAGRRAKANHAGAFVWGDQTNADFASTGADQFLIRASGGVGIGTTTPQANLHTYGDVSIGDADSANPSGARLYVRHGPNQQGIHIKCTSPTNVYAPCSLQYLGSINILY